MRLQSLFLLIVLLTVSAAVLPVQAETSTMAGSGTGYYRCHGNVDGATVYVDGFPKGEISDGILTFEVYTTATPVQTIMVTKEEYNYDTITSPQVPGEGETIDLYFRIYPLSPATGSIYVRSDPENADVYINGNYYGRTPQNIKDLEAGVYSVQVCKSGYNSWSQSVSVVTGDEQDVRAILQAIQNYGSIQATSGPSGASVYLDGVYYGKTPVTIPRITRGTHDIELQMAGYIEQSQEISVSSGDELQIYYSLEPDPAPTTGEIDVTTSPGNVEIYLDGNYEGLTGTGGVLVIPNILAGSHDLKAVLSGYPDQQTTVTVNSGQISQVTLTMGTQGANGAIAAESTPSGAGVYIDNQYKGITPITVSDISTGSHSVTLRLDGYQDFSTQTTVTSGSTAAVKADLTAVTTTSAAAAPAAALGALIILLAAALIKRH